MEAKKIVITGGATRIGAAIARSIVGLTLKYLFISIDLKIMP